VRGDIANSTTLRKVLEAASYKKEIVAVTCSGVYISMLLQLFSDFRNRLGMGFYGSINISYPLTPALHLFAEPYLRVFPGSVTNTDYPLEQRYRTQGVFVGIRKMMGPYWMNLRP